MKTLPLTQHSPGTPADGTPLRYTASRLFYYGPVDQFDDTQGTHLFDAPGSYVAVRETVAEIDALLEAGA